MPRSRQPTLYVPHGGGPWPWLDAAALARWGGAHTYDALRAYLIGLPDTLPEAPRALLCVTAHWEAAVPTVSSAAHPPMLYDYGGFPPETYEVVWPAPGDPALAARVRALLDQAGIPSAEDPTRGYDHGTFVPLAVAWPDAGVPTVQLSLVHGLDPATHLAIGRALAPLRDEGVLIVASGMSFHNLRGFGMPGARQAALDFDAWLQEVVSAPPPTRDAALLRWEGAPHARQVHPREEHLLPLMVAAGAAGDDLGRADFRAVTLGVEVFGARFG